MKLMGNANRDRPVILIAGAAEGLGASIAALFASDHDVLGLARTDQAAAAIGRLVERHGGSYTHRHCDLTAADEVAAAVSGWTDRINIVVHNASAFLMGPFEQTSATDFESAWRATCFSAFLIAQATLPHMSARQQGTFIFSGATASLRGGSAFAAFASAKFALRGLAQSLAREYGPRGVHVAHTVLDGIIDSPKTRKRLGPATAPRMDPDAIAAAYRHLALQPPGAWTHELDLRTSAERF